MKIRNGFVTNSSSSSFILGFTNQESIAQDLLNDNTGKYYERILSDCLNAEKMDLDTVLMRYRDEIESNVELDMIGGYTWDEICELRKTKEYKDKFDELVDKKVEKLKKLADGKNVFVEIDYEDHSDDGALLEHEIVPNLKSCLMRISWH